jgi:integrase
VNDLTAGQVEDWLVALRIAGMSSAMRRKVLGTLRMALKWARAPTRYNLGGNAAADAGLPKADKKEKWRPFPESEVDAILRAITGHYLEVHWKLALMLGPRLGEINGLWWEDLDLAAKTIEINTTLTWQRGGIWVREDNKTVAGQRTIRLPDTLWAELMAHRERQMIAWPESPFVFTRTTGTPLRGDGTGGVGALFQARLKRAKLAKRNFHQLRHLAASLLLSLNNHNLIEVGQILGHSTFKITVDLYGHLRPEVSAHLAAQLDAYYATRGVSHGVSG